MSLTRQNIELWGGNIPLLVGLREKGLSAFERAGLPTAKTEAWKYSYIKESVFDDLIIDTEPHKCNCHGECHCFDTNNLPFKVIKVHFCNGKPDIEHLDTPRGLIIKPLIEAIYDKDAQKYLNKSLDIENFPFAALNTAYLEQGLMIVAERNTIIEKPILLAYHSHGQNLWQNVRNLIVLESGAQLTLLEDFSGDNEFYFNNIVNEIYVGNEAVLTHYKRVKESPSALHIALNSVIVRQNGRYNAFCAQSECRLARSESYVQLQQEGAEANVNGAYRLYNNGHSDITTNIRHLAAHTTSNQLVKGVLDGSSRGVFQGQIHIEPNAQQTEGYQLHRALLLSDNAEVDCKPELEIFADDVKCSHGATSGDLDKEQLFYMQTRGIALADAKQILIEAYLNETLLKIENQQIREWLKEAL